MQHLSKYAALMLTVVESPLSGQAQTICWLDHHLGGLRVPLLMGWLEARFRRSNQGYAKACMRDSLARGEAPYASHLLFDQPGLLNDARSDERELGMHAGFAWGLVGAKRVFYVDRGMSGGMVLGLSQARELRQRVEFRSLGGKWAGDAQEQARAQAAVKAHVLPGDLNPAPLPPPPRVPTAQVPEPLTPTKRTLPPLPPRKRPPLPPRK